MSTTTITKRFKVDGSLTDPTNIKLSDPDGNYGVKRDDTDATVVDDATAMNQVSTGVYNYTFTDPAYGLTYSYYVEIVYSGETYHYEGTIRGQSTATVTGGKTVDDYYDMVKRYTRDWTNRRWVESITLDILNDGYMDFIKRTHCLRKNSSIAMAIETQTFSMPTDCLMPYRFAFNQKEILMVTDDHLDDRLGSDWRETFSSEISYVTMQMTGADTVRIYPIFDDFDDVVYDIDDTTNKVIMSYDGGSDTTVVIPVSTYIGDDLATAWQTIMNSTLSMSGTVTFSETTGIFTIGAGAGHTIAVTMSGSTAANKLGILANITDALSIATSNSVRLWLDYIYRPTELTATTDTPAIPTQYHIALFYYTMRELLIQSVGKDEDPAMSLWYDAKYKTEVSRCKNIAIDGFRRPRHKRMRGPSFI